MGLQPEAQLSTSAVIPGKGLATYKKATTMGLTPGSSRKRLLVLLGAGSTIHAGAPSTKEITEKVCTIPNDPIRSVVECLSRQRGNDGFTFETVLACLEELDEFKIRQTSPRAWDKIGGVLSAFADLRPDLTAVADNQFLVARWGLVNFLSEFVTTRTSGASPDKLKAFLDLLRGEFDLTVITLNYDDIVDLSGTWYDGFEPSSGTGSRFGTFDAAGFRSRSVMDHAILLHLHGSVRFGFKPGGPSNDIVRYDDSADALQSVKTGTLDRGEPAPIISGQRKDRWMTRACVPFGYYHNTFVNSACAASRVLIAGYSDSDPHVSAWIKESSRIHADQWRGVIIDKTPHLPTASLPPSMPRMLTFGHSEGDFPPTEPDRIKKIVDHLKG